MNIKSLSLLTLMSLSLLTTGLTSTSCSDDKYTEKLITNQQTGRYTGDMSITAMNMPMGTLPGHEVNIVLQADGKYTLKIGGYKLNIAQAASPIKEVAAEELVLRDVQIEKISDEESRFIAAIDQTLRMSYGRGMQDYAVKGGALAGTIKKGVLTLTYTFTPGNMPSKIVYSFVGQRR